MAAAVVATAEVALEHFVVAAAAVAEIDTELLVAEEPYFLLEVEEGVECS
jgi:hypothetical protein